ncbi:MAG: class F sortase, partial [Chloroflexi bacterium]|nr:class F sortase [Chloroflexota bacterium]
PPIAVFGAGSVPPSDGAILNGGPSTLLVQFSENILNDGSEHSVTSVWNYMLVRPGPNGIFDTTVTSFSICDSDHIAEGDDERIEISGITYNPATFTATLTIYSAYAPLANGQYRLYLCGAASIWDLSSNALTGGTNTAINFTVSPAVATAVAPAVAAAVIPATGFAPHRVTVLPPQTVSYAAMGDLWLEIPKLGVQMNIVGVPQTNGTWDVKWLGNDAGWLQGSAFPTWAGNSVLTGHVWNANNTPGVFVNLKNLKYGDQVRVHAFGQVSTYEVRESRTVWPSQVDVVLQHKDLPTLTLLTCEDYHILWGTYSVRRMVRAVLVSVAAEIQNP